MSDWDQVTVLRKRAPKASALKTETAINQVNIFCCCCCCKFTAQIGRNQGFYYLSKCFRQKCNTSILTLNVDLLFSFSRFIFRLVVKVQQLIHRKNVSHDPNFKLFTIKIFYFANVYRCTLINQ